MNSNIFRVLLSAVLMMCCTVSAMAQLGTPPNNEIWYTTNDGKVCEPDNNGSDVFGTIITSNTYSNGHGTIVFKGAVTAIGYHAFYDCSSLVSISMPNSVTNIGDAAFENCHGLTSISIPNSVKTIGNAAFGYCNSLKSITIPNSVTSIEQYAFTSCYGLTTIEIPNSVTNIEDYTFYRCEGLTTIGIPNSVTNIGEYAFSDCKNLSDVFFLGNKNISIGSSCFYNTQATIYVADATNLSPTWDGRPVRSWRSGNGNGTKESPLKIESYPQLYGFSLEVLQGNTSICAKLTADITANSSVLKEDGTPNGVFKQWLPIGNWGNNYNSSYKGEFDGGGHTVSGLYFNDTSKSPVGLFGMANGAYIHDVGVKDSYFKGKSHVAGICGDLANGKIENCWNAATVESAEGTVGGIAGSCWTSGSVSGCYNIGVVANGTYCGGICGSVAKNANVTYSVSNCFSLEGKCSVAYNLNKSESGKYDNANINNVSIKNAAAFASGEVCWMLNGNKIDTKWRQLLGKDAYPVWTGNYLVNYDKSQYYNETICEKSTNGIHNLLKEDVKKCDGSTFVYWHCDACGKDFTDADRTKEETKANMSKHLPEYVMGIVPTETSAGRYGYYHCTNTSCNYYGNKFMDESLFTKWDNDKLNVPIAKNDEIWYTTTADQNITHGVKYKKNEYRAGVGYIVLEEGVTEIADNAFNRNRTLSSVFIPSSIKKIGNSSFFGCSALESVLLGEGATFIDKYAFGMTSIQTISIPSTVQTIETGVFNDCYQLQSITFHSLPNVESGFQNCNISTIALDLTDSNKPHIGTSLANYPAGRFTGARYRRTLEKGKLETIVLPFVPTAESTAGLDFYTLTSATNAKTIFTKVKDIHAGEPYLIKNTSDTKEFTFIAKEPKSITIKSSDQYADNFTMKAAFQKATLTNDANKKFYYFNGEKFLSITENQEIDPFRAYIETPNTSASESLEITTQGGSTDINGDGTQANPYQIKNKADLDYFADIVNTGTPEACAILMADINYNGEAKLLDDNGNINSGSFDSWRPIGNSTNSYSGEFNGDGYTISGLYFNDENLNNVGLFGKTASGAHIHDLGIKDSYFYGKDHVGSICGDFAYGKIENCWNGATVRAKQWNAGGISGSCWKYASITSCYNIGVVLACDGTNTSYGGICGAVYENVSEGVDYAISNCYTLEGKCDRGVYGSLDGGCPVSEINNSYAKNAAAFKSGEVCWLLNGSSSEDVTWHQMLGEGGAKHPTLTGENVVYLTAKKCDGSTKAFSNTKPESVTQDEHKLISHDASVSTCTTQGCIKHRSCTECGHLFKYDSDDELMKEQVFLDIDPNNHSLALKDGKAHCEWCEQDWEHFLAQDNKPVLLNSKNDRYSLDKVELKYGHSYLCTDKVEVNKFSYTFRYNPNVWNSLFVPFEIATDELGVNGLGFTAAYIAGVRQYEKDASDNIITQVDVIKIKNGKLRAGTPYLIKKESSATEPLIVTLNKMGAMLNKSSDVHPLSSATTTASYDFIGTYNTIAEENIKSNHYIIGSKGAFVHPSSPIYAMNWYMEITDKGAVYDEAVSLAKTIIINVIGEEDQTTGIRTLYPAEKQVKEVYDLGGYLLNAPKKGHINIINGKKVFVK